QLAAAGARVDEAEPADDLNLVNAAYRVVAMAECAAYFAPAYREHPNDFGANAREYVEVGLSTSATAYLQAQRLRQHFRRRLNALFEHVDALLTPAAPSAAPANRSSTGDPVLNAPR